MKNQILFLFITMIVAFPALALTPSQPTGRLRWEKLPDLPPAPGQPTQLGLAGAFAGKIDEALIVAGGANFPDGPPWRGNAKKTYDQIYRLTGKPGSWQWTVAPERLPRPLAYGVTIKVSEGHILAGGCDTSQCATDVTLLGYDPATRKLSFKALPPLPRPLGFMGGAAIGSVVYLVGGQEAIANATSVNSLLALDLAKPGEGWRELPPLPRPGRIVPVVAAQNDGRETALFVFSGREVTPKGPRLLSDGWKYSPTAKSWTELPPVQVPGELPSCVMAAPALASGANHILVFGGDRGSVFMENTRLDAEIAQAQAAGDSVTVDRLRASKFDLLEHHPGFSHEVLAYHTITGTWAKVGEIPANFGAPVTTTAVDFVGGIVIPSGEVSPGVRSPQVLLALPAKRVGFGALNYTVLVVYLLAMLWIGWHFRGRTSTSEYFTAGGRIPWWAAGLSIFGTSLSAITFMAIPAKTFATDWRYFFLQMSQLFAAPIVIAIYIPVYRKLNLTTTYEYLEKRFNPATRLIGSLLFLLFQFGRFGIVLFLPSLALSVVTDINIELCILVMGVLTIIYTVMGGMEAVIWTDVVQVIVLMGGALLALVLVVVHLDGGVSTLWQVAVADHKLRPLDLTLSLAAPTFWVAIIGGMAHNLIYAGSDQTMAQRYFTTPTAKDAAAGVWTFGLLAIPAAFIFFGIGTALYVFYKQNPALLDPTLANPDAIFPWYIMTQMPPAVPGIMIAGVFAAAMSSLCASINSAAAVITTDFYSRFKKGASDESALRLAKWTSGVVGVLGTGIALMMAQMEIVSFWDGFQKILGLFAGGLGGLFLLGMISRRASGRGALVGLAMSCVVQYLMGRYQPVHLLMFTFTGLASSVIFGWLASLLLPDKTDRPKITIWDVREEREMK